MRRLPVYLLLDTSGSMKGEPIEAVKVGLQAMASALRQDPFAIESVNICIITFDKDVNILTPMIPVESFQVPEITTPESGPTHLGAALEALCTQVDMEIRRTTDDIKGDWKPLLFIMTDGSPSDIMKYKAAIPEIRRRNFAAIIACAAGAKAKDDILKELADQVVHLDTTDASTFSQFFKWVSASISMGNQSLGASTTVILPPPPPEVQVVV